jgi:hypothetical protein
MSGDSSSHVHLRIPSPGRLYSEHLHSGVCSAGHDVSERAARVIKNCRPHCRACRDEEKSEVATAVETFRAGMPSTEILDEAACSPADAWLFEPMGRVGTEGCSDSTVAEGHQRQAQAKAICARCPVELMCYLDGLKYRREGVYGGVSMSARYHRNRKDSGQSAA